MGSPLDFEEHINNLLQKVGKHKGVCYGSVHMEEKNCHITQGFLDKKSRFWRQICRHRGVILLIYVLQPQREILPYFVIRRERLEREICWPEIH